MIGAVIFDMDGVLVDSEMLYLNLRYQFAKGKNPEVTLEELYPNVGRSSEGSWGSVAKAVDNGLTWQELLAEYKEKVVVTYPSMDFTEVFRKEAPDVLRKLQEKGLRLALASSNGLAIVEKILRDNGIRDFFEVVVSGESFRKSKPDPEIYIHTAAVLGIDTKDCLVAEDSTAGITAAHLAGMQVAAVIDDRFGFDRSLADFEVEKITDIPDIPILSGKEAIRRKEGARQSGKVHA